MSGVIKRLQNLDRFFWQKKYHSIRINWSFDLYRLWVDRSKDLMLLHIGRIEVDKKIQAYKEVFCGTRR